MSKPVYLMATLASGEQVVSEFHKLGRIQRYVTQVQSGQKPFNAWRVVGTRHPVSGEPVLTRAREFLNGYQITRITQVEPTRADHGYEPANFRPVVTMEKGRLGLYTVPDNEDRPEAFVERDIPGGMQFPVHQDPTTLRRYVVLAQGDPGAAPETEAAEERRFYLDAARGGWTPDQEVEVEAEAEAEADDDEEWDY